jgi:hypothetical protein
VQQAAVAALFSRVLGNQRWRQIIVEIACFHR